MIAHPVAHFLDAHPSSWSAPTVDLLALLIQKAKRTFTSGTLVAQNHSSHFVHPLHCGRWLYDWHKINSEWSSPPLETSNHSISCSFSPSSVSMFAGDRLSAILNSIQSGPFLSAAPSSSVFEQAAQPPSSSSLVHSPFVFGQSPSQLSQPQPQLLSKSVLLSDSACLHRCWSFFLPAFCFPDLFCILFLWIFWGGQEWCVTHNSAVMFCGAKISLTSHHVYYSTFKSCF